MAIKDNAIGLVKESLHEMIHVAEYSINYIKEDPKIWGEDATGGILGWPSSLILFSVIDCIGSMFKNHKSFKVSIDGKPTKIKTTNQHIYILNSKYFNLNLARIDLKNIHDNVRSPITHNSVLPVGYMLAIGNESVPPFKIGIQDTGRRIYIIHHKPLLAITKKAVELFIQDIESHFEDFENSPAINDIRKRDVQMKIRSIVKGVMQIEANWIT